MVRHVLAALALGLACAPHERPREPASPCPTGMALVEPDPTGLGANQRFCVDLTEVTTAAYGACVHAGVCTAAVGPGDCNLSDAARGEHPINCTSFAQAETFCAWLGKRLPEDHEWIWASRGGSGRRLYPWGDAPPDGTRACWSRGAAGTCPVGSAPAGASPIGVLDLIGNVAEWTRAPQPAPGGRGHLRGGSWQDNHYVQPIDIRFADSAFDPTHEAAVRTSGLRCVVAPDSPVQDIEDPTWTPHAAAPGGLPVLAPAPPRLAPTRPLAHLALLHRPGEASELRPLADRFLALDAATAAALALTEPALPAMPLALRDFSPLRSLADTVLMAHGGYNEHKYVAVERGTLKLRWQADLSSPSYVHIVAPRTLVAQAYQPDGDTLTGLALDSGREVWRLTGGPAAPFTRVRRLWHDGERGHLIGDRGLVAFDTSTGAVLWSDVAVATGCGVASASDQLVVEDPDGHRVLDPTSGQVLRRLDDGASRCRWDISPFDGGTAPAVIEDDRLIAFDAPTGERPVATLRARDLRTGAELWRRPDLNVELLLADHDAVLVQRAPELLTALDAATGQTRAELSIGSPFTAGLVPVGGAAGPLVIVETERTGTLIVGRGERPAAPESYAIRGRLVPEGIHRRRVANVPVRVGQHRVRTDADGRFEVRGAAHGAVGVALGTDRGPDVGGSRVRFEPTTVVLTGQRRYDVGDVALREWELY